MKALKLSLFALIVSLMACSKNEPAELKTADINPQFELWNIRATTFDTQGKKVDVTGTLVITSENFIRNMFYSDGREFHDTTSCTFSADSIYFTLYGNKFAGKHFQRNDTLFTEIPPKLFYRS